MNPATLPISMYSGVDQYTTLGTGEKFIVGTSRLYQPDGRTPGILYCHGAGGDGISTITAYSVAPGITAMGTRLAELGYPVLAGDFGGVSTWGNAIAMARMDAARLWLQGPPYYAKPGKIIVIGGSMGGVNSVNFWRYNPANVYCVVTTIPVSDLDQVRNYSPGAFRDWVNGAYGLANGSTALYPTQITGPAWSAVVAYLLDQTVTRLGVVYRCIKDNINVQPPNATYWEVVPASTSFAALPGGVGQGNPATHLGELATMPHLVSSYATDDAIISPATVLTLSNATLTKERYPVTGFGGHTDASIGAQDMARTISFIGQYAPLPTGEPT